MAAEFQRPIDKVHDALPGTLADLVAATGYPAGSILELIVRLRSEGVRVNATEDGISRAVPRYIDRDEPSTSTTIFAVDSSSP